LDQNSTIQGIENGRASYAFQEVSKGLKKNVDRKEFRSYIKKLPTMIQVNGLGQALAFYYSKQEKSSSYKEVYNIIRKWLQNCYPNFFPHDKELVEAVIQLNSPEYRKATIEVIALLGWMKKFVEGMVQDVSEN
jgi:CRISPR-associated protein Cmr5